MHDLAIIGAGPAGMAAAVEARALGLDGAGHRRAARHPAARSSAASKRRRAADPALGADYVAGRRAGRALRACGAHYRPATTLWHIDPEEGVLALLAGGASEEIAARRMLLATGAQERPVPIPGWTLPGVMTAGAAQILLKTAGAVPAGAHRAGRAGAAALSAGGAAAPRRGAAGAGAGDDAARQAGRGAADSARAAGRPAPLWPRGWRCWPSARAGGAVAPRRDRAAGRGRWPRASASPGTAARSPATTCCCMKGWCRRPRSARPRAGP